MVILARYFQNEGLVTGLVDLKYCIYAVVEEMVLDFNISMQGAQAWWKAVVGSWKCINLT